MLTCVFNHIISGTYVSGKIRDHMIKNGHVKGVICNLNICQIYCKKRKKLCYIFSGVEHQSSLSVDSQTGCPCMLVHVNACLLSLDS